MESNHWIKDWLSARCEAESTAQHYMWGITMFDGFCLEIGMNFGTVVEDWRTAKYAGAREEQMFLDRWNDVISAFSAHIKKSYPPLSQKGILTAPRSFFAKWKIPVDVDLPKRACVIYHNKDLTKEVIRQILSKTSQRNRTIFLMLAESGLRAGTIVELKYWQIKKDFEAGTVPMQILTPSSELKYHVGDRWSFIGEDGVRVLREYLKPRMPLKDDDYVFVAEKAGLVAGKQFTVSNISTQFNNLTRALKYERGAPAGKPGHYRLHGLRKYFRNNMKADPSYREFWMGHSLGVDAHYISRDPEKHRKKYAEGYDELRILETVAPHKKEIEQLKAQIQQQYEQIAELRADSEVFKQILDVLRDPKKLRQFENLLSQ